MAKVLFFLQLIAALVLFPLWPGLSPEYTVLGLIFLGLVVFLPLAGMTAVHGVAITAHALADAWSTAPLGPRSRSSGPAWVLASRIFPLAGILGGATAVIGALTHWNTATPPVYRAFALGFFCLVWGFLGLLLSRILREIIGRLAAAPLLPLLVLTPAFSSRFGLTPRETEAAQAVLDGLTYRDAGARLSVGAATIKSHLLSVYQKTGAGNKIELLRLVEAEASRFHHLVDGGAEAAGRI